MRANDPRARGKASQARRKSAPFHPAQARENDREPTAAVLSQTPVNTAGRLSGDPASPAAVGLAGLAIPQQELSSSGADEKRTDGPVTGETAVTSTPENTQNTESISESAVIYALDDNGTGEEAAVSEAVNPACSANTINSNDGTADTDHTIHTIHSEDETFTEETAHDIGLGEGPADREDANKAENRENPPCEVLPGSADENAAAAATGKRGAARDTSRQHQGIHPHVGIIHAGKFGSGVPKQSSHNLLLRNGSFPRNDRGRQPGDGRDGYSRGTDSSGGKDRPPSPPLHKRLLPLALAGLLTLLLTTTAANVMPDLINHEEPVAYAQGWEVLLGDRVLAVVADKDAAQDVVEDVVETLSDQYNAPVTLDEVIAYEPVAVEPEYLGSLTDLKASVTANVDVSVEAWTVTVDGQPLATVASQAQAYDILMQIMAPYQQVTDTELADDMSFVEKVEVVSGYVAPETIISSEAALALLTAADESVQYTYTVVEGDTLSAIADHFSVTVEALRQMNPDLADTDIIQTGQTLYVALPHNTVNVRATVRRTREETVAYTTRTEKDSTRYTDQKKTTQQGVNGLTLIVEEYGYVNGLQMDCATISETVVTTPVEEVVVVGTKTRPKTTTTNTAGKFTLPLAAGTYRISSYFGTRTLNGVTRTHKGVDLAAPTGTAIYASRAGTVSYAGWASGYGLVVYIDHGNGVQTRYGHCSKLLVSAGDHVDAGQLIAKVGSTGDSTGPHCHFEVRINGVAVNPLS